MVFTLINTQSGLSARHSTFGMAIGSGILFLLLISLFNPTINTSIGERDTQTYKVLLMNPLSVEEIFLGKYLNVALQGLLILVPYSLEGLVMFAWGDQLDFFIELPKITVTKVAFFLIGTLVSSICVSAICFLACSFSKSKEQAQSLLSFVLLAMAIPLVTLSLADIELNFATAFIPVVNFTFIIQDLLNQNPNYLASFLGISFNLIFSLSLIWFCSKAFVVQWTGSNDTQSMSDVLNLKRRKTGELVPAHGVLAFLISFMGITYGSFAMANVKVNILNFLFLPILFSLGTGLGILRYSHIEFTRAIKWGSFNFKGLIKFALLGVSMSLGACLIFELTGIYDLAGAKIPTVFTGSPIISLLGNLILFAIVPCVCEEFLYRGIIFNSMRKQYPFIVSALISTLLFSLLHFTLYKWGHAIALGMVLAYLYEKNGIISSMLTHFCFNIVNIIIYSLNLSGTPTNSLGTPLQFSLLFITLSISAYILINTRNVQQEAEQEVMDIMDKKEEEPSFPKTGTQL